MVTLKEQVDIKAPYECMEAYQGGYDMGTVRPEMRQAKSQKAAAYNNTYPDYQCI
jgi:hypothetical protein